jgi:ubiquinol oxidase
MPLAHAHTHLQPVFQVHAKLQLLRLDASKVSENEKIRFKTDPPDAPWYIKLPYFFLCWILDVIYEGRPIQRFWVLEEVARVPYFAYISMLHLYESLGWWRAGAALRKVHFAEEWNELHHLQVHLHHIPSPSSALLDSCFDGMCSLLRSTESY